MEKSEPISFTVSPCLSVWPHLITGELQQRRDVLETCYKRELPKCRCLPILIKIRGGGTTDTLFWKPIYVPALKIFSLFEAVHYGAVRNNTPLYHTQYYGGALQITVQSYQPVEKK
jgi:hypothetical protein